MALIFVEPFVRYTTAANMVKRGWVINGLTYSATGGRFGTQGALTNTNSAHSATKAFPATPDKLIVQFAIRFSSGAFAQKFLYVLNNSGADLILRVGISAAGAIQVFNAVNVLVHTGTAGVLVPGVWHTMAVEVQAGSATGTVRIWINQPVSGEPSPVVDLTGINLTIGSAAGADMVQLVLGSSAGRFWDICEFMLYDLSFPIPHAYMGDKRLYALNVNGEGSGGQQWKWTPSTGTDNAAMVDDPLNAAADGTDAMVGTYVEATAANKLDLYTFEDLPLTATGIVAVVVELEARKTDAGAPPGAGGLIAIISKAGEPLADGPVLTLTTTDQIFQSIFYDVPGAGVGWPTVADVNDLEAGQYLLL